MLPNLTRNDLIAIERELCSRSLATFVRRAWHVIEPGQKYIHGWHVEAVCEHLEACTYGDIKRLLINIPPGTMKSTLVSVFGLRGSGAQRECPTCVLSERATNKVLLFEIR